MNNLGRAILTLLPIVTVLVTVCAVVLLWYRLKGLNREINGSDIFGMVTGMFSLGAAIAVICVFVLTEPPAVELLDQTVMKIIGLAGGMSMFITAWRETVAKLLPKPADPPKQK